MEAMISRAEFTGRLERTRRLAAEQGFDALLVIGRSFYHRTGDLAYLTNHFPPFPATVFSDTQLVSPPRWKRGRLRAVPARAFGALQRVRLGRILSRGILRKQAVHFRGTATSARSKALFTARAGARPDRHEGGRAI